MRDSFLAVSTALAGAQLAVLSLSALFLAQPHPLGDATDVLLLLAGTAPPPAAPGGVPAAAMVILLVLLSLLRRAWPRRRDWLRAASDGCAAAGACLGRCVGLLCTGASSFGFTRLDDETHEERKSRAGSLDGFVSGAAPEPPLHRWPPPALGTGPPSPSTGPPSPAVARALEMTRRRAAWQMRSTPASLSDIVSLYTAATLGDADDAGLLGDAAEREGSPAGRAWWESAPAPSPLPPRVRADAVAALGAAPVARLCSLASAYALAFGFQPSVVSHQCEHLLGLLGARAARPGASAATAAVAVHAALFAPYLLWCQHVCAVPRCSRGRAAAYVEACEAEALLFLLVWAEAANLRHAPEAVWWVFHQLSTDGRLPAPFLPAVVAPLVTAAVVLMRERQPALNYDDINEAFWQPRCLTWALAGSGAGSASSELLRLRKTYRERRSWLHVLGAFERVYFAHWLLLRAVLCAALGAHTCVAAEFGAICDAKKPVQAIVRVLQLEATCVVDVQVRW